MRKAFQKTTVSLLLAALLVTLPTSALAITNDGQMAENSGTVDINNGVITVNNGVVVQNSFDAAVIENNGVVSQNDYLVDINNGEVTENNAIVTTNYGVIVQNSEEAVVNENYGEVITNNNFVSNKEGGVVVNNDSMVWNYSGGAVENNHSVVTNYAGGEVIDNNGDVVNYAGGILNDVLHYDAAGESAASYDVYLSFDGGDNRYVPVYIAEDCLPPAHGEATVCGVTKQAVLNSTLNLREVGQLFGNDGYEVVGYEYINQEETGFVTVNDVFFTVDEGGRKIYLIWDVAGNEYIPVYLTHISAERVYPGAEIAVPSQLFRVLEVYDDSMLVTTCWQISEADLAAPMEYLQSVLTPEQSSKIIGAPDLLSEDLVAEHFGGVGSYICFTAQLDLFA